MSGDKKIYEEGFGKRNNIDLDTLREAVCSATSTGQDGGCSKGRNVVSVWEAASEELAVGMGLLHAYMRKVFLL